ncbi:MAG: signal recognition particle receptor subunit alpha [Comamonadaceae bacterium]|nr:signal recognition particle receptor subunit alpha [Comamonadaceae bacterium]
MFGSLREKLARTRNSFRRVGDLFKSGRRRDEILDELEEALILADVGVPAAERILQALRTKTGKDADEAELDRVLKDELAALLTPRGGAPAPDGAVPAVILMVGVNGGGKTTSAAKLAALFKRDGRQVVLAAADTFRAAAQEQLALWGKKLGRPGRPGLLRGRPGLDRLRRRAGVQGAPGRRPHRRHGRPRPHQRQPDERAREGRAGRRPRAPGRPRRVPARPGRDGRAERRPPGPRVPEVLRTDRDLPDQGRRDGQGRGGRGRRRRDRPAHQVRRRGRERGRRLRVLAPRVRRGPARMNAARDRAWMEMAYGLAEKARGRTSPNPLVGAVVVRDGIARRARPPPRSRASPTRRSWPWAWPGSAPRARRSI